LSTRNLPGGGGGVVKDGRGLRLTILPLSVSRLSRKCGNLDVPLPYGPPGHLVALPYLCPKIEGSSPGLECSLVP
jgi:hypothetical protein